ncbi:hypothetical protein HanPSC8_Chr06g0241591 [Helianthus annuus]|nr:hypothetical protein HanPSC8_Chr06g0241591 [Helianthus annuus]
MNPHHLFKSQNGPLYSLHIEIDHLFSNEKNIPSVSTWIVVVRVFIKQNYF